MDFQQKAYFLAHAQIYNRLLDRFVMSSRPSPCEAFLSNRHHKLYVKGLLGKMAGKTSRTRVGDEKIYEYDEVDVVKFMDYFGMEYCVRKGNGGRAIFYMDNIKIIYNTKLMKIFIEFVVVRYIKGNKDEINRSRCRPAWLNDEDEFN